MQGPEVVSISDIIHDVYCKADKYVGGGVYGPLGNLCIYRNLRGGGNDWITIVCESGAASIEIDIIPSDFSVLRGSLRGGRIKAISLPENGDPIPALNIISGVVEVFETDDSSERQEGALNSFLEKSLKPGGDLETLVTELSK